MEHGHLTSFYNIEVARENMRKMRSGRYGLPGKLYPTSMFISTKDGAEIPVTLSASLIVVDGKEMGSVGVFTDMREVLQMRRDLEEAQVRLVQSEKIASVGRMAAGVAHEINNPLSGILLYAELLKENHKDDGQEASDIQEIIDQTLRCKRIVSDLLEFSRQSIGKANSFRIDELITKCLNLLRNQATFHDIQISVQFDEDLPMMVGDMGQLRQVFTNLFINAADAMEGKGRLEISIHFDREISRFVIRVADTGPGIPMEYRDKVFDIFFTTKPVGKGTGLGLSISRKIIELHGGTITFECPPEGGTRFVIELPLEKAEPENSGQVFSEEWEAESHG
jgi:signal transduction histidine kinase